jgi:hypothetical protein
MFPEPSVDETFIAVLAVRANPKGNVMEKF